MTGLRALIDTVFVQALFNRADQYHDQARQWAVELPDAAELFVTEAVLTEVGNAFSTSNRQAAVGFIEQAYRTPNLRVIAVDTPLLQRALRLYKSRPDKNWGMTDCISFVVMADYGLRDALTADRHFEQAGFVALLLREP